MVTAIKQLLRRAAAHGISRLPTGLLTDNEFFEMYQERGVHIRRVHFYEPLPDTRELSDGHFDRRSVPPGIDMREAEQLSSIRSLKPYIDEAHQVLKEKPDVFRLGPFGPVDAEMLYSLTRQVKPKRIVEVGSGYSTLVAGLALSRNRAEGHPGSITAIEPYPNRKVLDQCAEQMRLKAVKVQEVPLEEFQSLEENDILFIDSSHVSHAGSDVNYEVHEILPSLQPGVYVHIHDQFFPGDYPGSFVLGRRRFWNEQYLVQAFLAFNSAFEIVASHSFLHMNHKEFLAEHIPSYAENPKHWASSLWLRRVVNSNTDGHQHRCKSSPLPVSTDSNRGATMGGWIRSKTERKRCV